jgi:hypothetical protein
VVIYCDNSSSVTVVNSGACRNSAILFEGDMFPKQLIFNYYFRPRAEHKNNSSSTTTSGQGAEHKNNSSSTITSDHALFCAWFKKSSLMW